MRKIGKSLLIIFFYVTYSSLSLIPLILLNINIETMPDILYYLYYLITQFIFILFLYFFYQDEIKKMLLDFKNKYKEYLELAVRYWVVGLVLMIISNGIISSLTPVELPENEQAVRGLINVIPIIMTSLILFTAPIIEEFIYRKVLYDLIPFKALYIIISSLTFGLAHVLGMASSLFSYLYLIPYAILGAIFAIAYVKTKNIFVTISMHFVHNLFTIITIFLMKWGVLWKKLIYW